MSQTSFDAIVVGGGPAGATAAAHLAQKGRRVVVLEREKFPRYHIGESLMPYCYFPLERLGLAEKMKESHFPKKYSVQFVNTMASSPSPSTSSSISITPPPPPGRSSAANSIR